ncbi:CaiB/BaiF CoA-transferase family protein [Reyranella sp. CPCC 100927]|uniref:CaiB/BaiF CoA transferase family protein n=1 Tax=Reyranella sp. CPCC 100927 TaxID=2599616 RepID=UPI0011B41C13|nr:CaiB/BaiF CoA-transferase family protein [Reyranella sp. CPCC 100927]TWS96144.1 CoA transferase [Reyranella sp. CPCC 100927]
MSQPFGPLQGVRVVSCSTAQAGTVPYMLMADLGADVIKIEVPEGGDSSRRMTVLPGMPSTFFETNNRGVKSVTLNLKTSEGREILHRLVARADIFGQNFRPGAAEKNGFGYEELRKINPKLVYVSISGYGTKGPHADLPGTDSMAQALGGIAEAYSMPGQKLRTGVVSVADETCAILAFGGALAALTHARSTGVGQKIDLSLLGGQIRLMGWTLTTTMWRNRNPVTGQARITGTAQRPGISASFNDRDGKPLVFQLTGPENWHTAMAALGFYPRLKAAGFEHLGVIIDNEARCTALLALLDELFATGPREDWVAKLRGADIVSAPINTLLEASNDPDVLANGYITEVDYPQHGKRLKVHGTPWQFSETPAKPGIAPDLGEHNDAVLADLGYSAAEIAGLRTRKII